MVRLKAQTTIVVQRQGPVLFTLGGDDGFRLFINGIEIISDWTPHSYRRHSQMVMLNPGIYELTLDYFEWTGQAELSFQADDDILEWQEARRCFGGFVEAPTARYFVYHPTDETPDEVASRFGISRREIVDANLQPGGSYLLPGTSTKGPKVIIIQGIDSRSSCSEALEGLETLFSTPEEERRVGPRIRRDQRAEDTFFSR